MREQQVVLAPFEHRSGESAQVVGGKPLVGPFSRRGRFLVEAVRFSGYCRLVVVPQNERSLTIRSPQLPEPLDAVRRISAVANEIPAADDTVDLLILDVGSNGLQSFQITMNV